MLDKKVFVTPSSIYRSAPFWAWNDKLERDTLLHQIHEMYEQGMGGFFMHPRGGLTDEYMGQHFMSMIKACVDEAERLGMKAWLYDEDRFPSGNAAGRVAASNPDFEQKALEMLRYDSLDEIRIDGDVLKIYAVYNDSYKDVTRWAIEDIMALKVPVTLFKIIHMPPQPLWNNNSYADLTCKDAVDEFLHQTHERYKESLQPYLGATIPGIFTDEPDFHVSMRGRALLPWGRDIEREFYNKKKYILTDHLPSLFLDVGDYKKIRFDYWDILSDMFINAFVRNIYEWCEQNGVKFTGHYWEHEFPLPIHNASVMLNYEFMHYPGIDMLFNTPEERDQVGNDFIVKEVSGVAHQLGKERVLSETHGASGWDLSFAEQKRVIDWQFALGVNLICQHLVLYSLRGYRKRDFPLSFMEHQPWWNCYKLLGDYIGRLSYALTQGDFIADIVVLHPSSSTWAEYDIQGSDDRLGNIGNSAKNLVKTLNRIHCSFDLGDDKIIENHSYVQNGRLIIGNMAYSMVILPDMTVMRRSTFTLLREFAQQGGHIIATGITPTMLEGIEDKELQNFFNGDAVIRCRQNAADIKALLSSMGNQMLDLIDMDGGSADDLYVHRRLCGKQEIIFICNFSRTQHHKVRLKVENGCCVEEWDAVTGEIKMLRPYAINDIDVVELSFYPAGSHLLVIDKSQRGQNADSIDVHLEDSIALDAWHVIRSGYNALPIERCSAALTNGEWERECNVLAMDDKLKDRLGMERGNIFVRQPWMYTQQERNSTVSVSAKYMFCVAEKPEEGDILLAAEQPDVFTVYVNGHNVKPNGNTFMDRAFVLYDIKGYVNEGMNEVILHTDQYSPLITLESIYIVGDFSVKRNGHNWELCVDEGLRLGDWTQQGCPYYSGKVVYKSGFVIDNPDNAIVKLCLGKWYGTAVRVTVNGQEAAILGWEPYDVDISKLVRKDSNEITVEVMNSLQNLLGPHQNYEGIVTPGSFYDEDDIRFAASGFDGRAVVEIYR
ncbi:glycosyl hydrolase [Mahella australiensis]|uniref:Glycoside hydrolase family 2 sugar binding protein n=1 Tax=Mahella australiensis (strain DSM 15567 / CIP 107919 / 50-1 BON) TaxID=697281 RepID=F4A0S6_MAHA5|nr:glycosyl hydrolase [Mahella australiensis]AEE96972.1 hypothetical protein Mahau_1791 [Mahella australiensis 50-1 BON]